MGLYSDKDFENFDGYEYDGKTKDPSYWVKKSRENSVGKKSPAKLSDSKEEENGTINMIIAGVLAVVLFALGCGLGKWFEGAKQRKEDNSIVYEFLKNEMYTPIVWNNTHPTDGPNGGYWYDIWQMGKEVANSDDLTLALYGVYSGLKYDPINNMNEVFSYAKRFYEGQEENNSNAAFLNSDTFDEYVVNLGFTTDNEKGEPDYNAYNDSMKQIILAKSMLEDATKDATFGNEASTGKGGK